MMTSASQTTPVHPSAPVVGQPERDVVPERDVLLDLLRTGALAVVVLWHWIFTSVRWSADGPHVGNPVATTPGLWVLTWVLQVMPAFFVVGGALHALDRTPTVAFWKKRTRRLLLPVLPLLGLAAMVAASSAIGGREDLVRGVLLVISPMWFLATYLVCIALAPIARRAHDRFGAWVVVGGVLAALGIDTLRIGLHVGGLATGLLAFCVVWGTVHQLGFSLQRLRAAALRTRLAMTLGGFGLMALAAWLGPYPAAMVGLDGHKLSNMGPPTTMVVFLGIAQIGLISLCAPVLTRLAHRCRPALTLAGEWSMTVYAWHLSAFAMFWALLAWVGIQVDSRIDAHWWAVRPVWLLGPALLAIPLCAFTRRFDLTSTPAAQDGSSRRRSSTKTVVPTISSISSASESITADSPT